MKLVQFEFAPIRYVHDAVADEALNVGVALFVPATGALSIEVLESFHRLSQAFPGLSGASYRRSAHELRAAATALSKRGKRALGAHSDLFEPGATLKALGDALSEALPDAGLAFRVGRVGVGLTADPKQELAGLYKRMVLDNQAAASAANRTDGEVWRDFKRRVKPAAIDWLRPRDVRTAEVDIRFEHTFVNGRVHAIQALSLDLLRPESIANKAARWVGYGVSLHESEQLSKLYLVLGAPSDGSQRRAYQRAKDLLHKMPLNHELVEEDEARDLENRLLSARNTYWKGDNL